ncbi:UNVERIFIED_CONTAM: hypothetical protein FKN15_013391 [Acipenser sinensis]
MPKAKGANKRKKFNYSTNRRKLKTKAIKAAAPRIECAQLRNAWNEKKSVSQNLAEMGLAFDPNKALPVLRKKVAPMEIDPSEASGALVKKPYVVNALVAEASLPEKDTHSISRDMIEYVQYMIKHHRNNYKEMAKDEKNYYQDTPKQIRRKVELYKRYHPQECEAFMQSLNQKKMDLSAAGISLPD